MKVYIVRGEERAAIGAGGESFIEGIYEDKDDAQLAMSVADQPGFDYWVVEEEVVPSKNKKTCYVCKWCPSMTDFRCKNKNTGKSKVWHIDRINEGVEEKELSVFEEWAATDLCTWREFMVSKGGDCDSFVRK